MSASLRNPEALQECEEILILLDEVKRRFRNLAAAGIRVPGRPIGRTMDSLLAARDELMALRDGLRGAGAHLEKTG